MMKIPFFSKNPQPIKKKSYTASSVIPLQSGSFLEWAFAGGGRVTSYQAMQFYRENSSVATAVDKIANAVEQIAPVLEVDKKFIDDAPVINDLRMPNPFETYQEFIGQAMRHYLLKHDSHLAGIGNINRPPIRVFALKPTLVSPIQAIDDYPGSYIVSQGNAAGNYVRVEKPKSARFLDSTLKELYHIMGFSSRNDNTQGDSPLEAIALEIRQMIQGGKHNLALLNNGGRLSLIVGFKEESPDDGEHKQRKKRINEDLGGADNAGGIAVISAEDVEIKEVGTSNKDMDYAKLNRTASQAVYIRYNIPLPLVSEEKSTYNNVENALFDFYENTVIPNANIMFEGLSKFLLPRYGIDDPNTKITYNPESIPIIIRQTLKEIEQRRKINVESHNEIRSLLPNREPISNGDLIYQNSSLIPVGEDQFTDDNVRTPAELEAIAGQMDEDE